MREEVNKLIMSQWCLYCWCYCWCWSCVCVCVCVAEVYLILGTEIKCRLS